MTKQTNKCPLDTLSKYMPNEILAEIENLSDKIKSEANELRFRVGKPAVIMTSEGYQVISKDKRLSQQVINDIFERLCDYSVYSHQAELSQGFITLPGGHRAGICGTAAMDKNGNRTIKYISSINIRIASEYIGCANEIFKQLFADKIDGVLIAGPPCSGKTTVLRDIAVSLSSGNYMKKVVIIDERGEIAAMYRGNPQNTIGMFCDVLNGYPKGEGILIALRTLAPDVIICDEIGGKEDAEAIFEGVNAGVSIIASIHACNADELYRRKSCKLLLSTEAFKKVAFLKGGSHRGELDNIIEVKEI